MSHLDEGAKLRVEVLYEEFLFRIPPENGMSSGDGNVSDTDVTVMTSTNLKLIVKLERDHVYLFMSTGVKALKDHVLGFRSVYLSKDKFLTIDYHRRIIGGFAQFAIKTLPCV